MWDLIEKLRTLPVEKRTSVATLIAIGLTLVIFVPWFSFVGVNIISDHTSNKAVAQVITPFSMIASEGSSIAETIKNNWGSLSLIKNMLSTAMTSRKDTYIAPTSTPPQKQTTTSKNIIE